MGPELSIVDLAFYPFFERFPAIQQYRPVSLPLISIRLRYWLDSMRERPSVKATQNPVDFYARVFGADKARGRRRSGNVEYLHA